MTKLLSKQAMQEMRIRLLGWEDPLEKEMATCSSLAWEIAWTHGPMDRGAWWATVHGVTKSLT